MFCLSPLQKSNMFIVEVKDNQEEENEVSHHPKFPEVELSLMT